MTKQPPYFWLGRDAEWSEIARQLLNDKPPVCFGEAIGKWRRK